MKDYHVNVFYSDEDEGYIADIPDLRHCSAFGATPQEALVFARERYLEEGCGACRVRTGPHIGSRVR